MTKQMLKRIYILVILSSFMLTLIAGKLIYSTLIIHNEISSLAEDQQMRSLPLKAPRGLIYDRNENELVSNAPCLSLYAIPYQVKEKEKTAEVLERLIKIPYKTALEKLNKRTSIIDFNPYGRRLDYNTSSLIQKEDLKGIYLVSDYSRIYPYSPYLSSLLGFVGIDNQGLSGLEAKFDNYLKGNNGYLNYYVDAKGGLFDSLQSEIISPSIGMSLNLTIDLRLQSILEREMDYAFLSYNADEVSAIIMDPNNGEILAIGNRPTYDNNNYKNYNADIYNKLLPINNSFEPGSTFKAMMFAAALQENKIDMFNDYYYDKGYEVVGGARINSWKKGGHGLQSYLEVLQNSSNPGFVSIARKLGKEKIYEYVKNYGFLEKTGIDISGENKGIFFNYENFNELEQATTCFGQGISVTAIQLITAFCSLINGGYLYKPHVVKDIKSAHLNEIVETKNKEVVRKVISKETSNKMRYALESVVAKGTGRKAYVEGYRVGGKTGTSQIAENGVYVDGKYILSFIAGAPMNEPKLVVYFSIKNAKNTIQYGGTTVGPIVGRIIHDSLKELGVNKQDGAIERTYTWMDTKTQMVENYIGKSKKEVKSKYFTFVFKGNGNKVIDQLPRVGTMLEENSTIMIYLGE